MKNHHDRKRNRHRQKVNQRTGNRLSLFAVLNFCVTNLVIETQFTATFFTEKRDRLSFGNRVFSFAFRTANYDIFSHNGITVNLNFS